MSGTSVRGEGSKPSKLGRMSLNEFKAARLTCLGVSWKGCCFLRPFHRYLDLCGFLAVRDTNGGRSNQTLITCSIHLLFAKNFLVRLVPRNHFSVPRNDGAFPKAGVPGNHHPIPRNTKNDPRSNSAPGNCQSRAQILLHTATLAN